MHTSDDRILTTHVGSLPRKAEVLEFLRKRDVGEDIDVEAFERAAGEAIRETIERQVDTGLDVINDGEQSRVGFNVYVPDRLSGYGGEAKPARWSDLTEFPEFVRRSFTTTDDLDIGTVPAATDQVEYEDPSRIQWELEEFDAALSDTGVDPTGTFMTAATPGVIATSLPNQYYEDYEAYVDDLAAAMRTEYEHIIDSEVGVLQLDAPDLLMDHHKMFAELTIPEFKDVVRIHVDALNRALRDVPSERTRLHVCWGNYEGPHHHDIALEEVLPILYEADVGGLMVEFSNPRHQHEIAVFEEYPLPDNWILYPGVIDVKTNVIEHPETVAERITRVAEIIDDPTRIVATPDCGFGTLAGWNRVDTEIGWRKLEAMVDGAALASESIY